MRRFYVLYECKTIHTLREFILVVAQIEFKCHPLTSVYVVLILLCQLDAETDVSFRYQKLRELPKHCPGHLVSKILLIYAACFSECFLVAFVLPCSIIILPNAQEKLRR